MWRQIAALAGGGAIGLAASAFAVMLLRRALPRSGAIAERSLLTRLKGPLAIIVGLVGVAVGAAVEPVRGRPGAAVSHVLLILVVAAVAWLLFRGTYVFEDVVLARLRIDVADNLRARRVQTQIQVFRRLSGAVIVVVGAAIVLLSFGAVRVAGASLLASAGVVGVVIGLAAKPVTTNFLAGIQIAISQPIRVDDVVVVEGHWGRVEEINLTYVVVRIWDRRCLVLPISYLITNPFENWTRTSADLLEYVHIDVDHSAPVEELRAYLLEVLRASPEWDGAVWSLQVTGTGPSCMQLRAVMSARDSSAGWILQCDVREKLVAYLRDHHPGALPGVRTSPGAAASGAPGPAAAGTGPTGAGPTGADREVRSGQ
ncbi:MAG: mechanosensitive ion channel [Actinomycetota bacterium]|jgi:small-conductance mechanosensitive channel|nr:mechanosensitive ion channel [Actinomycetota bacterium]